MEGEKALFYCRMSTNKSRKMLELENHYFTATIAIIDSGKNHQWMLKPLVKFVLKQKFYIVSNYFPTDYL